MARTKKYLAKKYLAAKSLLLLLAFAGAQARANTITFNFNSLANGAGNSSVQSYMNGLLGAGSSVTVTGSQASKTYNGDGHVVGPGTGGTSLTPGKVGRHDPAPRLHRHVHHEREHRQRDRNELQRARHLQFEFRLRDFPGWHLPDRAELWRELARLHVQGERYADIRNAQRHARQPRRSLPSLARQRIGKHRVGAAISGTERHYIINFAHGVTKLEFIDWPATIGIDNLKISTVPEPGSLLLLASGLLGIGLVRRGRRFMS